MDVKQLEDVVANLKGLSNDIQNTLNDNSTPLATVVDIGIELDRVLKLTAKTLEPVKVILRQKALDMNNQQSGTVELRSGLCTVQIPSPTIAVRKRYDMQPLKDLIGPMFSVIFREITTFKPQKEFELEVSQCDLVVQTDIMKAVELKDNSPRVYFKGVIT